MKTVLLWSWDKLLHRSDTTWTQYFTQSSATVELLRTLSRSGFGITKDEKLCPMATCPPNLQNHLKTALSADELVAHGRLPFSSTTEKNGLYTGGCTATTIRAP